MITLFFTGTQLMKLVHGPQGQNGNMEYFINDILEAINEECNHGAGY
jgi:hypothetical protein